MAGFEANLDPSDRAPKDIELACILREGAADDMAIASEFDGTAGDGLDDR